jgi:hypothetical protein
MCKRDGLYYPHVFGVRAHCSKIQFKTVARPGMLQQARPARAPESSREAGTPALQGVGGFTSSLNRDHMFETKQWQKPARRSHASSCCSSFTTSSATIDTCQFRLENCPRSLRSSCRDVDRVTASSVGRSRRHWGKPPRMPLGLTGQGAYTSSAGPRGGLTFWVHSEISGRSAARTR